MKFFLFFILFSINKSTNFQPEVDQEFYHVVRQQNLEYSTTQWRKLCLNIWEAKTKILFY